MPSHINGEDDLCTLIANTLKHYPSATATSGAQASGLSTTCSNDPDITLKEQVSQVVNVRWSAKEVGESGLKPGWYKAERIP